MASASRSVRRGVESVVRMRKRQIGKIGEGVGQRLKRRFAEQRKLLGGVRGAGAGTRAVGTVF
ncbi:MAG: hypothetical protein LBD68_08905 [Zoogloeaceae bacterium]|nr:hypothetical protein [Zoogloeaceae bacterium]